MARILAALLLIVAPITCWAAPDYTYCEIAGLANGAGKEFIGSIASRLVDKQGLTGDSICVAVWSDAYKKAERLSANPNNWKPLDVAAWQKMQDFETKVVESIIRNMDLGD